MIKTKLLYVYVVIMLFGCASTEKIDYNNFMTGDSKVDNILRDPAISDQTKLWVLKKHHNEKNSLGYGDNGYRPVVDPAFCKNCNYNSDLSECRSIASKNTNYSANTAGGAAAGAGIGAIIAAVSGLDVGIVASGGAVGGAIGGLSNEALTHNQIIARCMSGRGYNVLR